MAEPCWHSADTWPSASGGPVQCHRHSGGHGQGPGRPEPCDLVGRRRAALEREEILAGLRVDFLIPQSPNARGGGTIQSLERDFAAVITPGLEFAFQDFEVVRLSGLTARDEKADRDIWVCGPAAFVLLKARALRQRGENKDAYDLHYVLGHWREGLDDIVRRMRSLEPRAVVIETLGFLEEDFRSVEGIGPARIERFLGKDTYREPGWVDATGNNEFQVYVEDHGTPGAGLASGVYLYRMTTPGFTDTRRMVLLK